MAARKGSNAPPRPANLTPDEMQRAIPKLERRIQELRDFDPMIVESRSDPGVEALEAKIEDTLADVFGNDTAEFNRFRVGSLDTAGINFGFPTSLNEVREGYREGKNSAISKLQTIIELFQEKLGDVGPSPREKAIRALGDLELHPEVARGFKAFQGWTLCECH